MHWCMKGFYSFHTIKHVMVIKNISFQLVSLTKKVILLKQGRPPRNSEEGAVRYGWASVASETILTLGQIKLKKRCNIHNKN